MPGNWNENFHTDSVELDKSSSIVTSGSLFCLELAFKTAQLMIWIGDNRDHALWTSVAMVPSSWLANKCPRHVAGYYLVGGILTTKESKLIVRTAASWSFLSQCEETGLHSYNRCIKQSG